MLSVIPCMTCSCSTERTYTEAQTPPSYNTSMGVGPYEVTFKMSGIQRTKRINWTKSLSLLWCVQFGEPNILLNISFETNSNQLEFHWGINGYSWPITNKAFWTRSSVTADRTVPIRYLTNQSVGSVWTLILFPWAAEQAASFWLPPSTVWTLRLFFLPQKYCTLFTGFCSHSHSKITTISCRFANLLMILPYINCYKYVKCPTYWRKTVCGALT